MQEQGIRQPYMHIEELGPWLPPPTDEELAKANQTREEANKEAQEPEHNSFSDMPLRNCK
jgi:hypothetical protein